MVVPPEHPKMIIFSRKTNGCWVPSFQEIPIFPMGSKHQLFFHFLFGLPGFWSFNFSSSKKNLAIHPCAHDFYGGGRKSLRPSLGFSKWLVYFLIWGCFFPSATRTRCDQVVANMCLLFTHFVGKILLGNLLNYFDLRWAIDCLSS